MSCEMNKSPPNLATKSQSGGKHSTTADGTKATFVVIKNSVTGKEEIRG